MREVVTTFLQTGDLHALTLRAVYDMLASQYGLEKGTHYRKAFIKDVVDEFVSQQAYDEDQDEAEVQACASHWFMDYA